ncbi:LacI family DNA-binding transcriptional regulator [Rugosimonospora africana]|uniref:LacI family transcriptional regulator n=1 Tax=Rugosimonospora africana TaxID=556532 RepID=A0A8J3VVM6_9ACTN|nr:LacI family DNA-binding transcriptional regulator [Rugosimonospora africana]GIH20455.1 LacI family transcriptional regulator [Rugosimonospora africana]
MTDTSEPARAATIYTVARHAGVSIATVSRVLQGSRPTSPATRQRVLRAVEALNYVPLRAGRPLATRHEAHGLVLAGLSGPYFSELLVGYESTANQYGQSVVVVTGEGRNDIVKSVRNLDRRVDGVVLTHGALDDTRARMLSRSLPTVLVGRPPLDGCDTVAVENATGTLELVSHLIEHGRRRLVFAGDPAHAHDIRERYAGFRAALERHGLAEAAPPIRVFYEELSAAEVVSAIGEPNCAADGLVCANDEVAVATMALLTQKGVKVPDDVAVVGFDDIMTARYMTPGLTTVRQPTYELGRWAAIRLHERIQGRTYDVHPQLLPTTVVVRGSCGCPMDGPEPPRVWWRP